MPQIGYKKTQTGVSPVVPYNLPFAPDVAMNTSTIIRPMDLKLLTNFLCTVDPTDIGKFFEDPTQTILSLRRYPFNITATLSNGDMSYRIEPVTLGNIAVVYDKAMLLGIDISQLSRYFFTAGEFDIEPFYESFLDLSPYTSYNLYLPFYGYLALDPVDVHDKHINITYIIDFNTGYATIVLMRQKRLNGGSYLYDKYEAFKSVECKIAIEIPVTSVNASEILRNNLTAGGTVLGAIANAGSSLMTGNIGGVVSSVYQAGVAAVNANQRRYSGGEIGSGTAGMFMPSSVILITQRPRVKYPDNYNALFGRPCATGGTLTDYDGFVQVGSCHTDKIVAPTNEVNEIVAMLQEGVII